MEVILFAMVVVLSIISIITLGATALKIYATCESIRKEVREVLSGLTQTVDNFGSQIALKADKIDLQGKVSFFDLSTPSRVQIDPSNVKPSAEQDKKEKK